MRTPALLTVYLVFVTGANVMLKHAADAGSGWPLVAWLAAGNLAGFGGILAYTLLLRSLPLHVAFPLSRGVVVLGILVTSVALFHEGIKVTEAVGAAFVTAGIILVGSSHGRNAAAPGR